MGLLGAALFLLLAVTNYSFRDATMPIWFFWAVFWLLFALVQYERTQFFRIIVKLERKIGELEGQKVTGRLVDDR